MELVFKILKIAVLLSIIYTYIYIYICVLITLFLLQLVDVN